MKLLHNISHQIYIMVSPRPIMPDCAGNPLVYRSPVYHVIAVPVEKVVPNSYNPNTVAPPEMKLLYDSIKEDGYTMPIVCYHYPRQDVYAIVFKECSKTADLLKSQDFILVHTQMLCDPGVASSQFMQFFDDIGSGRRGAGQG